MKEKLITPAGLVRLEDELDRLKTDGRREITERIRRALAMEADASANADYLAVREDQAYLESRIARLEERVDAARVAEPDPANDILDLGERVRIEDLDTGRKHDYQLVGSFEANPGVGWISNESPLGRALVGRRTGDVAVVDAPKGTRRFRIVAIRQPAAVG